MPKTFACAKCFQRFSRHADLSAHTLQCKSRHHSDAATATGLPGQPGTSRDSLNTVESSNTTEQSVNTTAEGSNITNEASDTNEIIPTTNNENISSHGSKTFCPICKISFKYIRQFAQHKNKVHTDSDGNLFQCNKCPKTFRKWESLISHFKNHRGHRLVHRCPFCRNVLCLTHESLLSHIREVHAESNQSEYFKKIQSGLKGVISMWMYNMSNLGYRSVGEVFANPEVRNQIGNLLRSELLEHPIIRVGFVLHCLFEQVDTTTNEARHRIQPLRIPNLQLTYENLQYLGPIIARMQDILEKRLQDMRLSGSNWSRFTVLSLSIEFYRSSDLRRLPER